MSMMCKINGSCEATPGMCVHEKMMLGAAVLTALGVAAYWLLA